MVKKILVAILCLAYSGRCFVANKDTLRVTSWSNESVNFKNASDSSETIDSLYAVLKSGKVGTELYFLVKNRDSINVSSQLINFRRSGDTLYPRNLREPYIKPITIPVQDSIYLSSFVYGSCILCTAIVNGSPNDYVLELNFMLKNKERTKIVLIGQFVSGGIVVNDKMKRTKSIGKYFTVNGKEAVEYNPRSFFKPVYDFEKGR